MYHGDGIGINAYICDGSFLWISHSNFREQQSLILIEGFIAFGELTADDGNLQRVA
jgi:hypothetical protein